MTKNKEWSDIMKFCTQCGAKMEDDKKFCTNCGHSFSETKQPTQEEKNTMNSVQPISKAPMSKKQKVTFSATAIIIVLLIILYFAGASMTSKDRVISNFKKALAEKNSTKLASIIKSSDPSLKVDANSLKPLISYIGKNPSLINTVNSSIDEQSKQLNKIASTNNSSNYLFSLKKQGKKFLFFDNYVFVVKPFYMNVNTNYKNVKVTMDNKVLCTSNQENYTKQVGPFLPGTYSLKSEYASDYANLNRTVSVDLIDQSVAEVDLSLDGQFVSVNCDYPDAKLLVNGKDTGLTVKDAQNFGPLSKDETVKLSVKKDFPWGTVTSKDVEVTDSDWVDISFSPVNDTVQNDLMNTANDFQKGYVNSLAALDPSKLVNATDNDKEKITDSINNMKSYNQIYKGTLLKASYDLDQTKIYTEDDKYYATIISSVDLNEVYYYSDSSDSSPSSKSHIYEYTLIYDDSSKKWSVENAYEDYFGSIGSANTKIYNFQQ